ncbi:MAG: tRNA pseudouridine(55) synthase TruB [Gammaproteobacteria bacterium]
MAPRERSARRARGRQVDGVLLLDKPVGVSSNQALQRVKRLFQARKAGHTGNLDVLASGLLPICFGEATKVCQFLLEADKHYISAFTFGRRTSTGDAEGEVLSEASTDALDAAAVSDAMRRFDGWIEQLPPMHSALKRNGQPLYKLARQGLEVERATRRVRIDHFELEEFEVPTAVVDIRCSKGTYVRTLAEDLGAVLGCGAYVSALRRAGAGPFHLDQAHTVEELEALAATGMDALDAVLLRADRALEHLPRATIDAAAVSNFERGQAIRLEHAAVPGAIRLYDGARRFLGVGEVLDDGRVVPRRLFHSQASESQRESLPAGT